MTAPVLHSMGCRLNAAESAAMGQAAAAAGLGSAVIVNTCAVTAQAVRQARQDIRRLRRDHPGARLVVTGCAAQVDPGAFAAMPEVDHVLGNGAKTAPRTWAALAAPDAPRVAVGDVMAVRTAGPGAADGVRVRAHVEVQNGCDHRCTFCIIPYGRGPSRSVAPEAVVAQVARLAGRHAEVVLTGVDLTSWGADLPGAPRLGDLVRRILREVPGLARLRLSSIDAVEIDDALRAAFAEEARLMPYLHLSLQHGADLILKRMKRRHLAADAIRVCAALRAVRPDIAFGADLIAGFPTETEGHHAESAALIEACGIAFLHVFPFSARAGTPAARMPQLPGEVVRDRAARLRAAGEAARACHLGAQVGRVLAVLAEGNRTGRAPDFTPVRIDAPAGQVVRARVAGHDGRALLADPGG